MQVIQAPRSSDERVAAMVQYFWLAEVLFVDCQEEGGHVPSYNEVMVFKHLADASDLPQQVRAIATCIRSGICACRPQMAHNEPRLIWQGIRDAEGALHNMSALSLQRRMTVWDCHEGGRARKNADFTHWKTLAVCAMMARNRWKYCMGNRKERLDAIPSNRYKTILQRCMQHKANPAAETAVIKFITAEREREAIISAEHSCGMQCDHCGKDEEAMYKQKQALKRCSVCEWAWYCSKDCQKSGAPNVCGNIAF